VNLLGADGEDGRVRRNDTGEGLAKRFEKGRRSCTCRPPQKLGQCPLKSRGDWARKGPCVEEAGIDAWEPCTKCWGEPVSGGSGRRQMAWQFNGAEKLFQGSTARSSKSSEATPSARRGDSESYQRAGISGAERKTRVDLKSGHGTQIIQGWRVGRATYAISHPCSSQTWLKRGLFTQHGTQEQGNDRFNEKTGEGRETMGRSSHQREATEERQELTKNKPRRGLWKTIGKTVHYHSLLVSEAQRAWHHYFRK